MKKEVTSKVKHIYLELLDCNTALQSELNKKGCKLAGENLHQALIDLVKSENLFNIIELNEDTLVILKSEIYPDFYSISAIYKLIKDEKEDNT